MKFYTSILLAFVYGLGLGTSMPPLSIFVAPFVFFPAFLWLLSHANHQTYKNYFILGTSFGFGYYLIGLYWVTFSLGVDIERFYWLVPLALIGIPMLNALFIGVAALPLKLIRWEYRLARVFCFSLLWLAGEWVRGHVFLPFPWNLMGYTWERIAEILQLTSVFGIYGLSLLTVFGASILYTRKLIPMLSVLILAGAGYFYGDFRMQQPIPETDTFVRIVQPNISQEERWHTNDHRQFFHQMLRMSALPAEQPIDVIVWPESAIYGYIAELPQLRSFMSLHLPDNTFTILGSTRRDDDTKRFWNTLFVIDDKGKIRGTYDKHTLVPFGEYVPLRWLIPDFITKITAGEYDFVGGDGPETFEGLGNLPPFSTTICSEAMYPGQQYPKDERPEWMVNITNDAWFGDSSGPYQHLLKARVRTIEEGLPLIRGANTGISAVIDAYGNILQHLPLNSEGIIDASIPGHIAEGTLYSTYRNWMLIALVLIFGLGLTICYRRKI
ncbi:MAG: apolipoprotein N-acyltransferase [Alphaproteobacteria bacterium]